MFYKIEVIFLYYCFIYVLNLQGSSYLGLNIYSNFYSILLSTDMDDIANLNHMPTQSQSNLLPCYTYQLLYQQTLHGSNIIPIKGLSLQENNKVRQQKVNFNTNTLQFLPDYFFIQLSLNALPLLQVFFTSLFDLPAS